MNSCEKGKFGEEKACNYLKDNGYSIVDRNYRIRGGEIDIIARKDKNLVFIEVKSWGTIPESEAGFSLDGRKKRKLLETAENYLLENKENTAESDIRFDFIFIGKDRNVIHSKNIIMEN